MSTLKTNLRRLLYTLKRKYPFPIDVYRDSTTYDPLTGRNLIVRKQFHIRKAVVLPGLQSLEARLFYQTLAGFFDIRDRSLIIDGKDLPEGFAIRPEDFIVWNHQRYKIVSVEDIEYNLGFFLVMRQFEGPEFIDKDLEYSEEIDFEEEYEIDYADF